MRSSATARLPRCGNQASRPRAMSWERSRTLATCDRALPARVTARCWITPERAVWRRPARLLLGHGWSHPPAGRRAPAARPHHKRRQASRTLYAIWQSSALGGRRSRGCWPAEQQLAAPEEIDLSASYAYPDSEPDLRMLRLVGHPVVVNPDAELHRIARGGLGGGALRTPRTAAESGRRRVVLRQRGGVVAA